jgi:hypothetical protein
MPNQHVNQTPDITKKSVGLQKRSKASRKVSKSKTRRSPPVIPQLPQQRRLKPNVSQDWIKTLKRKLQEKSSPAQAQKPNATARANYRSPHRKESDEAIVYEFASPSFDEDASANKLTGRAEHEIAEVGSFTTCSSTQKHLD